ncbi:MAG TPA: hypothetical protein DCM07_25160, partial [Planctomycetaceae bacterium]|nr:hypothetical protein [Planctomycetaceae bacterium]
MAAIHSLLIILTSLLVQTDQITDVPLQKEPARYEINAPNIAVIGIPVSQVTLRALNLDGTLDTEFSGHPKQIIGLEFWVRDVDTALPPFENGVLELKTDLAQNQKVFITADTIVVDPDSRRTATTAVYRISRWLSL